MVGSYRIPPVTSRRSSSRKGSKSLQQDLETRLRTCLWSFANPHSGSRPCPTGPTAGEMRVVGSQEGKASHSANSPRHVQGLGEYTSPSGDRDCFQENGQSVLSPEGQVEGRTRRRHDGAFSGGTSVLQFITVHKGRRRGKGNKMKWSIRLLLSEAEVLNAGLWQKSQETMGGGGVWGGTGVWICVWKEVRGGSV